MMTGRKRKPGAIRQPGGRIDHSSNRARHQKAEDMRQIALEARTRVFAVSPSMAVAMPESSFLGVLRAAGRITARQMDAAAKMREACEAYDAVHPIKGFPYPGDFNRQAGAPRETSDGVLVLDRADQVVPATESFVHRFERASDQYMRVATALSIANGVDHRARQVTEAVVLRDAFMPHQEDALRVGLDHIADAFRLAAEPIDIQQKIGQR